VGPVTVSLNASATRHFNSKDLKDGNPAKGLSGGIGTGQGNWRLELDTPLDIDPLAYTRPQGDGFVTSTHDVVAEGESMRWRVPFFNPGGNSKQHSWLRVVNISGMDTEVMIEGRDDRGAPPPGGEVRFSLPADAARMLSAKALEEGSSESEFEFDGSFGDGSGKWQLFVSADHPIQVMSLLLSDTGHLTNLSTSSVPPIPTRSPVEHRMVPISFDDQRIRLAVRIFRPDGKGPFPTLIFHHGSTGNGTEPLLFPWFWQPDTVIHYFVDRGWSVVLPSRRGRGGSEGGYDEGFGPDRSQGYSFSPAYSLPGADRALADINAITDVIRAWPFFTPDSSHPPAAFLGQWNGWWGSVGTGTYTSVTISSVTPGGEAIGTYTYDTGTYPIRDSVADGVLRHQWPSPSTACVFRRKVNTDSDVK